MSLIVDFNDMKKQMRADQDKLIESMTEALIAYSLSREREFTDQQYVESIIKVAKKNGYRFKPMIKAFIKILDIFLYFRPNCIIHI